MKRRLLALALALCIALSLVPAALAADTDTNTLYYKTIWSPEETWRDPLVFEPNLSYSYRFFTDEACTNEVTADLIFVPDDDASAGAIVPSRGTEWDIDVWFLDARRLCTGTLTYTENGTTYTLAVSCVLPTRAFSSEPTITEETLLASGRSTFLPGTAFYYVFPADVTIESAAFNEDFYTRHDLPFAMDAAVELLPDQPNVCKITVNRVLSVEEYYYFAPTFTLAGRTDPMTDFISLRDATPRLGCRDVRWTNGELDGYHDYFYTNLDLEVGNTALVGFFYGNTQDNTLLNITSAAFYTNDGELSDALTAEKRDDGSWCLNANALTEGILLCTTADGKTYTMPVTVSLPRLGFYTSQTRSGDACIADFFYYNARTGADTFWLISKEGLTADEADAAVITCEYNVNTNWYTPDPSEYLEWKKVSCADDPDRYDLKFTVKSGVTIPQTNLNLRVELPNSSAYLRIKDELTMEIDKPSPAALTVTIDGTDYAVGFGTVNDGILTVNLDGNWSQTHPLPQDDGTGAAYRRVFGGGSWQIYAATVETREIEDGTEVVCTPAPAIRSLVRVRRVWLERRSGSGNNADGTDSFSLAADRLLERTGDDLSVNGFPLYVADKIGEAYLCAEISVGGKTGTIYYGLKYVRSTVQTVQLDSVEAINNWLETNAEAIRDAAWNDSVKPVWNLELTGGSYKGTVTMPETLRDVGYGRGLGLRFLGQNQTFTGSIDLGGTAIAQIGNLNFVAPEKGSGTAISRGSANIYNCSFTGYETALGSGNTLVPHDCRFLENETAVVMDIPNPAIGCLISDFSANYFEKNGTALRIVSTNSFVSPYYIRPYDSVFIGNTVDFDVQTAGTFYFLCNFFAHHDSILPSIRPVVKVSNGATVYVNPVWKYRSDSGALSELTLVEGEGTRLPVNEDWSNTSIAADSLTSETQIALADENDNTVATWSDFREQAPAQQSRFALYSADEAGTDTTPDGFCPGVSIDTQPTGEQTVTVADSAALAEKTPLLTIPCALKSAVVRLNGKPVASELEDGKLSFRVAAGGTYTVRPGTSVKYEDGTFTIQNAPANAVTAIAALYDQNGRFLTAAIANIDATGAATIPLQIPSNTTYRVYYLTANNTPAN